MTDTKVLKLNGLSKRFGPVVANDDVSLSLNRGEVLALLGENGAGKTTLMNMLFGHYLPDAGSVEVADTQGSLQALQLGHPQAALAAGVGMVHQHFALAENINALDNITLGSEPMLSLRRNRQAARAKVEELMARSGLTAPLDVPVGRLSVGERQRVEILKALYRDARILVLDEPTAVLTPQEADTLFASIKAMTKDGLSVIFISHKLREVLAFSDRIAVLRHGKKVGEMPTSDADENMIATLMVGAETPKVTRQAATPGTPLFSLKNVSVSGRSKRDTLNDVSVTVHANEILGIAGVSGNGQTGFANLVSGLAVPSNGTLHVHGEQIAHPTPAAMIEAGIGRIPEDRHHEGIVGAMSVAENMVIERLHDPEVQSRGLMRREAIQANAERLARSYDVRGPGTDAPARLLSGGNIQKLILARVFERSPRVILANQPTRGLDMGAAAEVGRRLLEARNRGAGVILISEDLDEVLGLADRIMVIRDGALIEAPNRNRTQVGLMMAGEPA
ncbi:sugar ABC transporter ATP-binding protein [Actibacterium mucosum KCTC 23349]|uniref:Sugar ABC transporter ATP-binding protein n=1 Tax=Actibacterium mucosum KCTC 23349 TaxID=1454373 RepID=A0A037ZKX4_9RHOB|nr:ABC transporter ATP-binding protein [Actibacterium mucosum]KAJ56279.1 sugar ABC transporter ATP-binding protein [Actibacterium mucosum KCTC 23349]